MDKQQITSFIQEQLAAGTISKEELMALAGSTSHSEADQKNSLNLISIFYFIGSITAVIGVCILVAQNWDALSFLTRLLVTLGISFVTYITALFLRGSENSTISQVMFTISAALAPLGVYVLFSEAGIEFTTMIQLLVTLALTIVYGIALLVSKRNILVLITVGYASIAYFTLVSEVFGPNLDGNVIKWAGMLLGISYICMAYGYSQLLQNADLKDKKESDVVRSFLYNVGTFSVLVNGLVMGGIFDLIYVFVLFAVFYASVFFKNRSTLLLSALFLVIHIIKVTSEYFIDSIGWPVALIGMGFTVIGIGYATYHVNKKYISNR